MDKILCCIARKSCVVRRSMQEFSRSWSGILLLSLYEQIPPFSSYGRNPQRGLRAAPFFDTPSPLRGEGWDGGGALLLPSPLRRRLGWRFTPSPLMGEGWDGGAQSAEAHSCMCRGNRLPR